MADISLDFFYGLLQFTDVVSKVEYPIRKHAGIDFHAMSTAQIKRAVHEGEFPEIHAHKVGLIYARDVEPGEELTTLVAWDGRLIAETRRHAPEHGPKMLVVTNLDCVYGGIPHNEYLVGMTRFMNRYEKVGTDEQGLGNVYQPIGQDLTGYVVDRPIAFQPYWGGQEPFYLLPGGVAVEAYNGGFYGVNPAEYLVTYQFNTEMDRRAYWDVAGLFRERIVTGKPGKSILRALKEADGRAKHAVERSRGHLP